VDIQGTKGTDRVEVTVTLNTGDSYRIYDKALEYRK